MAIQLDRDNTAFEHHDRVLFEIAPIAIWREDWSEVQQRCAELRAEGVADLRAELAANRDLLHEIVSLIRVVEVNQAAATAVGATDPAELAGRIRPELLNEDSLLALLDQIMIVWQGKADFQCDIAGVDINGAAIDTELHWAAPVNDGVPDYSHVVIVIQDVGKHRTAERAMGQHVDQLETLIDLGRGLASSFDVDVILDLLVEITGELLDSATSLIMLFDTERRRSLKTVAKGCLAQDTSPDYKETIEGLSGWVVTNRSGTISPDLSTDDRITGKAAERFKVHPGMSAAIAPIISDAAVTGTLAALKRPDQAPFTERDMSLLRMLAAQAAVAIRNAAVYEELHTAHEELKHTQTQLLAAQKLEAIGSLAAGIAHEINTPIQYVSDNTSFVKEAIGSLAEVAATQWGFLQKAAEHEDFAEEAAELQSLWKEKDCEFLLEEIPVAADETIEGARRVAEIVRAMKEFAHPGSDKTKSPLDINRVIETTTKISRNEWKYVADLELDLDDTLPMIPGLAGPLGQSFLIMFVNSAQAMAEHGADNAAEKGTIRVTTSHCDEYVEVRVADNGPGIPPSIADRIFDPFFTTKEVGKGSGQGLSIARSVVVDKHQGEIWVEDGNPGAVFVIRLPLETKSHT